MNWLIDVGLFALLFFVLVFIHELGHFLMAKWVGIRVERFAIGMGPTLLSFKHGPTEYKLGLLPLGGYVKMAGDDPTKEYSEEERRVGFLTQKAPAKLLVVFGGPAFNLLLPIFLFGLMLATGIPTVQPIVGTLEKDLPAAQAGLMSGDKILSVNQTPITKWSELEALVEKSTGQPLDLEIERLNTDTGQQDLIKKSVVPKLSPSKSKFGEDIQVGRLGVSPDYMLPEIFFETNDSILAKAGLERFDRVTKINGVPILTFEQLRLILSHLKAGSVEFTVDRKGQSITKSFEIPEGNGSVEERIGFRPVNLVLDHIEPASPAEKAGMKKNDYLVSIGKTELHSWDEVAQLVRGSEGKSLDVTWSRDGKIMHAKMVPEKTVIPDPLMGKDNPLSTEAAYRIGVSPALELQASIAIERSLNPLNWLKRGLTETWKMVSLTVQALSKLFTGKLSMKLLGSPIMIYKVAGNSYRMAGGGYFGWFSFVSNLALLSITLGLVNLLPIPVLDGGHAAFFLVELIRGRPVSVKVMEIATQVGLVLLICLFAFVIYNDLSRYGWLDSILKLFH